MEEFRLSQVPDLIARKMSGPEHGVLDADELDFHKAEYVRLVGDLERAAETSNLPEEPTARPALHDLLVRLRSVNG